MIIDAFDYVKNFGFGMFLSKSIRHLVYRNDSTLAWIINDWNQNNVGRYLEKAINPHINAYNEALQFINSNIKKNDSIFVMWWQGESTAPDIVKCCIASIKENAGSHKVIILSENNINEYINLPQYVLQKFRTGAISRTHLSDIIRLQLLSIYGGMWIDATVLVTAQIPDEYFSRDFYSIHFGKTTKDPSRGRWTTFLMAGKGECPLFVKTLNYHYQYWEKHDAIVDYIMFDYYIDYCVRNNESCKRMIDSVAINNEEVFNLVDKMNAPLNEISDTMLNSLFYKLSWKRNYERVVDGKETLYSKIIKNYLG